MMFTVMIDEGPSAEDIARFSDTEGYCPDCGEQVYDNAQVCPVCRSEIDGRVLWEQPIESWFDARWKGVVVALVILGLMSGVLYWLF
jgi:predicted amidophosphoribosyltransferase